MSFGLKDWVRPYTVRVERATAATSAELRSLLEHTQGDGWICFTDRVERWKGGTLEGTPLSGEICLDEQRSLHVRQQGSGWTVSTFSDEEMEGPLEDSSTVGYDVAHESAAPRNVFPEAEAGATPPPFEYRVYWRTDNDGVYRPWAARFLGWR